MCLVGRNSRDLQWESHFGCYDAEKQVGVYPAVMEDELESECAVAALDVAGLVLWVDDGHMDVPESIAPYALLDDVLDPWSASQEIQRE